MAVRAGARARGQLRLHGGRADAAYCFERGANIGLNDVMDFALDHDNTSAPLRLHWTVVGGPAGWDPYPGVTCPGE